jgi:hypothetical protein
MHPDGYCSAKLYTFYSYACVTGHQSKNFRAALRELSINIPDIPRTRQLITALWVPISATQK